MKSDTDGSTSPAQPVAWAFLAIPALALFLLHIFTAGRYGIFRDEYYYLACAARPAWGYVDQPPFSIWVLAVWKALFGDSVHSLRILPALCGSASVMLTGVVAAELGGRKWAQLLAGSAVAVGIAGLVLSGFYSMNAFDLLFWTGAYLLVVRIAGSGDGRWWLWLGLVLGLGLFNKIGLLVFGAALALGIVSTRHRRHLAHWRVYGAGALALAFLVPYVLWNMARGWPTLEFMENAKLYKISEISPLEFLSENVLEANPLSLPLLVGGLCWLLVAGRARPYRIVGLMIVITWVILVLQKSKPYYFASSLPVLLAAGGVAWEGWTQAPRWQWVRWLLTASLIVGLAVLLPLGLPILSPQGVAQYQVRMGIVPNTGEVGHTGALPQYFSDRFGWEELAELVSSVYVGLSPEEQAETVVMGQNYGHGGALEYWSDRYELPPVYARHNNYWLWGPPPLSQNPVIIATGFQQESLEEVFLEVVEAGRTEVPYAIEGRIPVWVCQGLRRPIQEVWEEIKLFI